MHSGVSGCVPICACSVCRTATASGEVLDAPDASRVRHHQQINLLLSRLTEPQRRWYAGSLLLSPEAPTEGELSRITGLDEKTIRRGSRELQSGFAAVPAVSTGRQRREGGGRFASEKKSLR